MYETRDKEIILETWTLITHLAYCVCFSLVSDRWKWASTGKDAFPLRKSFISG